MRISNKISEHRLYIPVSRDMLCVWDKLFSPVSWLVFCSQRWLSSGGHHWCHHVTEYTRIYTYWET